MNKKDLLLIIFIGLFAFFTTLSIPNIVEAGLVPCGPGFYDEYNNPIPCQICHLFVVIQRIINFILHTIVPPLAGLFLVFAGYKYYHAAIENPDEAQKVKGVIISVFIGLIILYGSLEFLTVFTEHIGRIPIYSHIQDIIFGNPNKTPPIPRCPVPPGFWPQ